jgi:hypothetical protein
MWKSAVLYFKCANICLSCGNQNSFSSPLSLFLCWLLNFTFCFRCEWVSFPLSIIDHPHMSSQIASESNQQLNFQTISKPNQIESESEFENEKYRSSLNREKQIKWSRLGGDLEAEFMHSKWQPPLTRPHPQLIYFILPFFFFYC